MPFTGEQFFDVFRRYNEAVWPAQLALNAVAALIVVAALRAQARIALVLLSAIWMWTAVVYFKTFFATITPAAEIFGSLFIAESGLLLLCAWQAAASEAVERANVVAGASLIGYALLVYPVLGFLLGHRYPASPTFGAPCPVTIFTFGVFCLLPASVRRFAIVVPVLWSLIASFAAYRFGVHEDLGLLVAATVTIAVVLHHPPAALAPHSGASSR